MKNLEFFFLRRTTPLMINIKTLCNGECSTRVLAVQIRLNIFQKDKEVKKKEDRSFFSS